MPFCITGAGRAMCIAVPIDTHEYRVFDVFRVRCVHFELHFMMKLIAVPCPPQIHITRTYFLGLNYLDSLLDTLGTGTNSEIRDYALLASCTL